jgi:uncharacterized protein
MQEQRRYVVELIALNGGEIVGKIRLQKIAYLLEAAGLGIGLDYDYHHYGPYSADLAQAAEDARLSGLIEYAERLGYHEVPYAVFSLAGDQARQIAAAAPSRRVTAIAAMKDYSAVDLEIAATAAYLKLNGYVDTFDEELRARKPMKATPQRVSKARRLISTLGL